VGLFRFKAYRLSIEFRGILPGDSTSSRVISNGRRWVRKRERERERERERKSVVIAYGREERLDASRKTLCSNTV
jgi:hypothetical protein